MAEFDRKTAVKIKVDDLLSGDFVKSSGDFEPSYVNVKGSVIGRVNIMGVVVDVSELKDSFSVDDGSGMIEARSFNNDQDFQANIGDTVTIIGKPREFNSQIFVSLEVLKKTNPKWIELRRKELARKESIETKTQESLKEDAKETQEEQNSVEEEDVDEENACDEGTVEQSPANKITCMVKDLDQGQGADFDDVVNNSGLDEAEDIINRLLEEGELFEVKSGRLKVLE